jgi:hypothetical protein
MQGTRPWIGTLLTLGAVTAGASAQFHPPNPTVAPDTCNATPFYTTGPCGAVYGPNYYLRPGFEPWNGYTPPWCTKDNTTGGFSQYPAGRCAVPGAGAGQDAARPWVNTYGREPVPGVPNVPGAKGPVGPFGPYASPGVPNVPGARGPVGPYGVPGQWQGAIPGGPGGPPGALGANGGLGGGAYGTYGVPGPGAYGALGTPGGSGVLVAPGMGGYGAPGIPGAGAYCLPGAGGYGPGRPANGPYGPFGPYGPYPGVGGPGAAGPFGPYGPGPLAGANGPYGPFGPYGPYGLQGDPSRNGPYGPFGPYGPYGAPGFNTAQNEPQRDSFGMGSYSPATHEPGQVGSHVSVGAGPDGAGLSLHFGPSGFAGPTVFPTHPFARSPRDFFMYD